MRAQAIITACLLALCLPALTADESSATCTVHAVYSNGQAWLPVVDGWPLPDDQIEWMEAQGTWHLEDGTAWDPHSIITESITVIQDGVVYPAPDTPDPEPWNPEPAPDPEPTPRPDPTPRRTTEAVESIPVPVLAGIGIAVALGLLLLVIRRR